jgi:hypothetical protein
MGSVALAVAVELVAARYPLASAGPRAGELFAGLPV